MGYRKKGSTASLVSSGSFALVLVLAGSLMGNPEQALTGIRIAFGAPQAVCFAGCCTAAAHSKSHGCADRPG